MTAGIETLKILEDGKLIEKLNRLGDRVRGRLKEIFEAEDIEVQVVGACSLLNTHFTKAEVKNTRDVFNADRKKLMDYHLRLISRGVFFLLAHTGALSTAHSEEDIEKLFTETQEYAKTLRT
jgi:glutamate-1-semialdehyde 2,1-aminomutase